MASCGHCGGNLFYKASEGSLLKAYCPRCEKPETKVILVKGRIPKQDPVDLPWDPPDAKIGTLCEYNGTAYVWGPKGWILTGTKDEGYVVPQKKQKPNGRREAILAQRAKKRR